MDNLQIKANVQIPRTATKPYDLEKRTMLFAKEIVSLCGSIPGGTVNEIIKKQLLRSGTSIGANYIEASESLGKKDFLMHIKIARKEAKETTYWAEILLYCKSDMSKLISPILDESIELRKILNAILAKYHR